VGVAAAMDIARLTRSGQEDRWWRRSERPGVLVVGQAGDDVARMRETMNSGVSRRG